MKKYILFFLLLAAPLFAYAEKVEVEAAKGIAVNFLKTDKSNGANHARAKAKVDADTDRLRLAYTKFDDSGTPLFYVFNNGFSSGFVIVSADDCITSVLGYSDSGYFDIDSISDITKEWLDGYGAQIQHGITAKVQRKASDNQSSSHIPVAPLTRSEWGQGAPYNNDCPNQYPAGCVPVAVGQVMYYYRWPDVTNDNYVIEWDRILADYKGASSSSSRAAVAGLIRHIGINADTQYAEDGSSTYLYKAIESMAQNYKYNSNYSTKYKSSYNDKDWENLIYTELNQKRLVLYSANNSSSGHAFIIDGYEYGYFHVNWGWNGQSNGYFLLSALMDFNQDGCVVVDLYPDGDYSTEENIVKWGYCNDDLVTLIGAEERKGGGVIIPKSELKSYIGKNVIGMEVGLVGDVQDMECFISLGVDNNIISSQWFETGYGGWNRILFDYPYMIEGEEIFAGYTFWEKLDDVAIATSTRTDTQKMYGSNSGYTFDGTRWSAGANSHIAVRLLLEGSQLPLDVRLTEVDDVTIEKGESLYLTGSIENMSNTTVDQCTFMYSVGGNETKEATINVSLSANQVGHFSIPTDWEYQDGYHDINVWITKVNGKEDAVQSNNEYWKTHSAQLKGRGQKFKRRMVVEESTGTWCGWCPRGIVALERMKEEYPDDFIGIAIHGSDEMSGADNYRTLEYYPSGLINRVTETGMSYSTLRSQLSMYSGYADVDIDSKANYTVKKAGCLEVNTNLTWGTINPNHTYQLAFAVLEDNVGPYAQNNSGYTDGSLADLGWPYTDLYVSTLFNDVARGIYDTYNGIPGSIAGDLLPNVRYQYNNFLTLPSTVANKDNVNIVCMVIDVNTGEIMNAVKTSIMDYSGSDNLVLSHNHIEIDDIEPKQLYASIMRDEYLNLPLEWSSQNDAIATVDQTGLVNGVSEGNTIIYVQIKDMPMTRKECEVSVSSVPKIYVDVAGTLDNKLGNKKYEYNKLKITGTINGDDLDVLSQMMGSLETNGNLKHLDLSEARIVKGGEYHYYNTNYTLDEDDILPKNVFNGARLELMRTPNSLKRIEIQAFDNSSLKEIYLNEGLVAIGQYAFSYTRSDSAPLKKLHVPSTVKTLDKSFIYRCDKLTDFSISENNPYYEFDNNAIYTKSGKEFLCIYPPFNGIIEINDNCETIGVGALGDYNGLPQIKGVIGNNVKMIKSNAFIKAYEMEFIAFGSKLSYIDSAPFTGCRSLKDIYIGSAEIPSGSYKTTTGWPNIVDCTLYVPSSSIDAYKADSFWGKMKAIKPIENTEYAYLANLGDGSVRKTVTMSRAGTLAELLGDEMFDITHLKIVGTINGDDLEVLSQMMGCNTENRNLTHLDLTEARIVKGGEYQYLNSYYALDEDDCLPNHVFSGSKSLRYISMPSTLKKIGYYVLYCSISIDEIFLNEGLEMIDYNAFSYNSNLKRINIPSTLKTISMNLLRGCHNVEVTFDNRNPYLCCDGNAIYSAGYSTLLTVIPSYQGTYTLHENCRSIKQINHAKLKGLIAPNVRSVEKSGFFYEDSLSVLAFGSPLSTIGSYGLYHCENLKYIYLGCKTVPEGAYRDSKWDNIWNCMLYVPSSSIDDYKADSFWGRTKAIKAIEDTEYAYLVNLGDGSVQKIVTMNQAGTLADLLGEEIYDITHLKIFGEINGDDLDVLSQMMGCNTENRNLTHLDLTEARIVKGGEYQYNNSYYALNEDDCLPNHVFSGSKSLRYISVPSTLKKIGVWTFCYGSIEEIVLSEGLETIGYRFFDSNSNLKRINIPSTLKSIGSFFLCGCHNVEVTFDDRNPYLSCDGNAIYSADYNDLLTMIPSYIGTYTVHENCRIIKQFNHDSLTGLIAPNVRTVDDKALYYERSLTVLAFGSPLRTIGSNGLYHCEKLEHIYLGCKNIPEGEYRDSEWDNISNCTLYVPKSSIDAYKADPFWGRMKAVKAIEGTEFEYLLNPESSSIEAVEYNTQKTNEIYELDGRKVKNPSKGFYIINGQKVVK